MATIAAIGVGVAAAGTIASTAMKASAAGKAGKGGGAAVTTSKKENIFNRGTMDILDEERRLIEDTIAAGNYMTDEQYRALGYEPIYQDTGDGYSEAAKRADALRKQYADGEANADALKEERRNLKGVKTREARQRRREIEKELKQQEKARQRGMVDLEEADRIAGEQGTLERRIVGLKKLTDENGNPVQHDPTNSRDKQFVEAFNLMNEGLSRALKGEEPIDATLKSTFDEKERLLHENLRRTLGGDYANSTAGAQALANFDRERTEAYSQYNREVINQYSGMTENRAAALSNLTGQQLKMMEFPTTARLSRAAALDSVAQTRGQIHAVRANDRNAKGALAEEAAARADRARMARAAALGDGIESVSGAVGGGLVSYGMGAGGGGRNQWGGAGGTGDGDPYWQDRADQAGM
jgi:hypothetical protein